MSDFASSAMYFHADKSLVFSCSVLFLTPSSIGKAVAEQRALTLGQGQLTWNMQITKLSLWSQAHSSYTGTTAEKGTCPLNHQDHSLPLLRYLFSTHLAGKPLLQTPLFPSTFCQRKKNSWKVNQNHDEEPGTFQEEALCHHQPRIRYCFHNATNSIQLLLTCISSYSLGV